MTKPAVFGELDYGTKFEHANDVWPGILMKVIPLEIEGELKNAVGVNALNGRLRRGFIEPHAPAIVVD